jgi:hypothetical protein
VFSACFFLPLGERVLAYGGPDRNGGAGHQCGRLPPPSHRDQVRGELHPPPPSVADLGSLSRILNYNPGSQIPQQQGGGVCCLTFFRSHKFHKIENYFIFEQYRKNRSHLTFYPSSQIYRMVLGSGSLIPNTAPPPIVVPEYDILPIMRPPRRLSLIFLGNICL